MPKKIGSKKVRTVLKTKPQRKLTTTVKKRNPNKKLKVVKRKIKKKK